MSADLNPLAQDSLFAQPALQSAEFRNIADLGSPSVVIGTQVAPLQRTHEVVFVDTACSRPLSAWSRTCARVPSRKAATSSSS